MKEWKEKLGDSNTKAEIIGKRPDGEISDSWTFIGKNIGKKASNYNGTQDISRMRESIWSKAELEN